jgi:hypothetical protein
MQSQHEFPLETENIVDPVHRPIILSRSGNGRISCWNWLSAPSHQSSHFHHLPECLQFFHTNRLCITYALNS